MKPYSKLKFLIAVVLMGTAVNFNLNAQNYKLNNEATKIIVEGTSNIHDWDLKAEKCSGELSLKTEEGKLQEIEKLNFSLAAESLKSGKSGMDKNTYKALKTENCKNIDFSLEKVNSLEQASAGIYNIKAAGTLQIAGVKKKISLNFKLDLNGNTVKLSGQHQLNMTDYKVDPPTAMFGTITTGETVTIKFETTFNK